MKILTMGTLKGGAGKTMNLFNLAGLLAEENRVLLIDVDPQCNLTQNVGIDISNRTIKTIKDIFFDYKAETQPKADEVIIKSPIRELPNLDIIPSSIGLFEVEDDIILLEGRSFILKNFIKRNKETFETYDYVILDTNPSMSVFNVNAFYIADSIIISSDVSSNSITGAELFCGLWDKKRAQINETADIEKEDNIAALLIGNFDKRINLSHELVDYVHTADFADGIALDTVIPATVQLKDTEIEHKPINIIHRNESAHIAFERLKTELSEKNII